MDILNKIKFQVGQTSEKRAQVWFDFLKTEKFDFDLIQEIDFTNQTPRIFDSAGNKFCIDFSEDRRNYDKKKSTLKKELIGRAMGSGRFGLKVLDLSAGLGIDAIFLAQLGFDVTSIERNPLVYLALNEAQLALSDNLKIKFVHSSAQNYLQDQNENFDVIYFDPMFPEKIKSALPRQEMVFFRKLVGLDADADQVLQLALQKKQVQRVVVKRLLKAPVLLKKPQSQIEGKLIRFDIYGGFK